MDETFRLAVAVLGARSLRSFPTTLNYDPQVLELVDVEVGSAWQGGSRPVLLVDESEPGKVTLGISRLGASAGAVQGLGELVELRFRAAGGGETEISLERFALLGAGSTVQSARAQAARVTVR